VVPFSINTYNPRAKAQGKSNSSKHLKDEVTMISQEDLFVKALIGKDPWVVDKIQFEHDKYAYGAH